MFWCVVFCLWCGDWLVDSGGVKIKRAQTICVCMHFILIRYIRRGNEGCDMCLYMYNIEICAAPIMTGSGKGEKTGGAAVEGLKGRAKKSFVSGVWGKIK